MVTDTETGATSRCRAHTHTDKSKSYQPKKANISTLVSLRLLLNGFQLSN